MVDCQYLKDGGCAIIAYLTGCDQSLCIVAEDACKACLACDKPQTLNRVTASIGLSVARKCQSGERLAEIRSRLGQAVTVEQPKPAPAGGPGTELKSLLSKLGFRESKGCGCKSHAREMDHKGTEWCRENVETIVGWLREEAAKQGLPFVDAGARMLIKYAIRRASK